MTAMIDVVVGQRAVAQVADRADLGVGVDDPLGQVGQLFFEANVGGHGGSLPGGTSDAQGAPKHWFGEQKKRQEGWEKECVVRSPRTAAQTARRAPQQATGAGPSDVDVASWHLMQGEEVTVLVPGQS